MKKMFMVLMLSVMLVMGGTTYADAGWINDQVQVNPFAGGGSNDYSDDYTWNDGAWASGGSNGEAENFGQASAESFCRKPSAFARGQVNVFGETNAGSFAIDFGKTSIAGAGIVTDVTVMARGESGFENGFGETYNKSKGNIGGQVYQRNFAQEVGYGSGTFAQAGNESGASFSGKTEDSEFDWGMSNGDTDSNIRMYGTAGTFGGSLATVDPYGKHQSATALTGSVSFANVCGGYCNNKVNAFGNGSVAVGANAQKYNSGAYAGGNAGYSYNGASFGAGFAVMNAEANVGNSSFNSNASGFAFSTTTGIDQKRED